MQLNVAHFIKLWYSNSQKTNTFRSICITVYVFVYIGGAYPTNLNMSIYDYNLVLPPPNSPPIGYTLIISPSKRHRQEGELHQLIHVLPSDTQKWHKNLFNYTQSHREVQIKVYIHKGIVWKRVNKFTFIYKILRVLLSYISRIYDFVYQLTKRTILFTSRS